MADPKGYGHEGGEAAKEKVGWGWAICGRRRRGGGRCRRDEMCSLLSTANT